MNRWEADNLICLRTSGRSQIAEAYSRDIYGDHFEIENAGLGSAEALNPLVVKVMEEVGIDLSKKKPQSVFELFKQGKVYAHVMTVCHDFESKSPLFPGITKPWHWPFDDPAKVEETEAEKLDAVRKIRDSIKAWLLNPPGNTIDFEALIDKQKDLFCRQWACFAQAGTGFTQIRRTQA